MSEPAAPYEPVYKFFDTDLSDFTFPVVQVKRGPIVYKQPTEWDHRKYQVRRQGWRIRHWFRSGWWPARIRALEAQIAELEEDDWD